MGSSGAGAAAAVVVTSITDGLMPSGETAEGTLGSPDTRQCPRVHCSSFCSGCARQSREGNAGSGQIFLRSWECGALGGEKGAGVIVTASAVCQAARILPKITESLRCLLKAAGMMQKNWPRAEVESNYAILL